MEQEKEKEKEQQNNKNINKTGKGFNFIAWILAMILLVKLFGNFENKRSNPNKNPQAKLNGKNIELVLAATRNGHYVVDGYINNKKVTFLIDTGASYVSLSSKLANELKLTPNYAISLQTANGTKQGFTTKLNTLQISDIKLHNVDAVFSENMGDEVLLGMSALKQLTLIHQNGKLVLIQINK